MCFQKRLPDVAVVVEAVEPIAYQRRYMIVAGPRHAPIARLHAGNPEPLEHLAVPIPSTIQIDIEAMHKEHVLVSKFAVRIARGCISSRKGEHLVFVGTAYVDKAKHIVDGTHVHRQPERIHRIAVHLHRQPQPQPRRFGSLADEKRGIPAEASVVLSG